MPPFGVRFKLEAVDKGNKPDEKSACRGHGEPRMQADFVLWGPGLGLRLLKNTILSTDPCCRKVLSFAEKKRRECFYNLILPFCPITFLTQPSAPYFSFSAARTSPLWSWPALPKLYQIGRSFSFQIWGVPRWHFRKQKKDHDNPAHHRKCPVWAFKS